MNVLAMYLPQFHQIKENDMWWGEGFTDWVSTRAAKPVFEGHYQPHVPLNGNYYDLMKKSTMEWQAELMRRYGVDGACMYHYWFKDGRRILEKPAENLLAWKDIRMPFCFCWANETWAKSWSAVRNANVWTNIHEEPDYKEDNGVLLEQKYGSRQQWEEHFGYLLPFFRDERYIRVEHKPLFVIYRASEIPCLKEMLECWREMAGRAGLAGIYVIGAHCGAHVSSALDGELFHEPARSRNKFLDFRTENDVFRIEYKDVWKEILQAKRGAIKTYFGGFSGYDDTPRRGKEGIVIEHPEPEQFGEFLTELMAKNAANGSDMVFLNAWNEWGEGMHLEPDEKYGTKYLEEIPRARAAFPERVSHYLHDGTEDGQTAYLRKRSEKFESYLNLLDRWMLLRENGAGLADYLIKNGIKKVAVYGFGILGRHLLRELSGSMLEIVGIVDRQKDKLHVDCPVYLPSDDLPEFDVMVVTPYYFWDEIEADFAGRGYRLISIETLVRES